MGRDNPFNAMTVLGQYGNTVYLRIPYESAKPCDGCSCDYCKAHPELTPKWDVMCVPFNGDLFAHSWTVHMPVVSEFIKTDNQRRAREAREGRRAQ